MFFGPCDPPVRRQAISSVVLNRRARSPAPLVARPRALNVWLDRRSATGLFAPAYDRRVHGSARRDHRRTQRAKRARRFVLLQKTPSSGRSTDPSPSRPACPIHSRCCREKAQCPSAAAHPAHAPSPSPRILSLMPLRSALFVFGRNQRREGFPLNLKSTPISGRNSWARCRWGWNMNTMAACCPSALRLGGFAQTARGGADAELRINQQVRDMAGSTKRCSKVQRI